MEKHIKWIWTAIIVLFVAVAFLGWSHYRTACHMQRWAGKCMMGMKGEMHHMKDMERMGGMGEGMRRMDGEKMKKDGCCKDASEMSKQQTKMHQQNPESTH